jgi:hypothetical protein
VTSASSECQKEASPLLLRRSLGPLFSDGLRRFGSCRNSDVLPKLGLGSSHTEDLQGASTSLFLSRH